MHSISIIKCVMPLRLFFSFIQRYRITTAPTYLRLFAFFAYICGFTNIRGGLRFFMEIDWIEK